jgi:ParB family chromosome partitioning protein
VRELEVNTIQPNRSQPRTTFEPQALNELADSIREHGIIQPLIVTARPEGGYELVAGERRWRAAQLAGLERVPALVREIAPQRLLELALVENIQRADLSPIEEGLAYEALKREFNLTDEVIARRVGKGRVAVTNARRLLGLIPEAQQALLDGAISAGHGRAILIVEQQEHQSALLEAIRSQELSVRAAERLASLAADARLTGAARRALLQSTITSGHAQALLRLPQPEDQSAVLETILVDGLGVQETERLSELVAAGTPLAAARNQLRPRPTSVSQPQRSQEDGIAPQDSRADEPSSRILSPDDAETMRLFEQALNTPVSLARSGSTIRLTITLYGEEQLSALYDLISGGNQE